MNANPEFSFFVNCEHLKEAEKNFQIEADADQRVGLAQRLDLSRLDSLKVKAVVSRQSADLVALACECSAEFVQQCVVTSKPLESNIVFNFERLFSATATEYFGSEIEPKEEAGIDDSGLDGEALDPPDPMTDGGFDLGECVVEQLLLEIDPFPRAAGASFDGLSSAGDAGDGAGRVNPFAVLEQLKKKL